MPSVNTVIIMGNLARDPEMRCTQQGAKICDMTIAVNRNSRGREDVCFVDVVVWGKLAENAQRYLKKGSCAMVEGYLKQDSWTDRNGGGKRTRIKVVAESVQFISSTSGNNTENAAENPPPSSEPRKPYSQYPGPHNGDDRGEDDDIPF